MISSFFRRGKKSKKGFSLVFVLGLLSYSVSAIIVIVANRDLVYAAYEYIRMVANALVVSVTGVLVNVFIKSSSSSKKKKKKDKH